MFLCKSFVDSSECGMHIIIVLTQDTRQRYHDYCSGKGGTLGKPTTERVRERRRIVRSLNVANLSEVATIYLVSFNDDANLYQWCQVNLRYVTT